MDKRVKKDHMTCLKLHILIVAELGPTLAPTWDSTLSRPGGLMGEAVTGLEMLQKGSPNSKMNGDHINVHQCGSKWLNQSIKKYYNIKELTRPTTIKAKTIFSKINMLEKKH